AGASEKREEDASPSAPEPGVVMKGWNPDTPYLKKMQAVPVDRAWKAYLEQKKEHGDSAGFYLDCADFFIKAGKREIGLQVLSNVAELDLENAGLLRILAHRLAQMDELELSRLTFETVLRLRPEEPQSYRDLALVVAREQNSGRALELLKEVVMRRWDRFPEIEIVALMEYNSILARMKGEVPASAKLDDRLIKNLDCDMRIVMTWDTDMADMDIWVIEPNGEKAFYNNKFTQIGGLVSRDFTQGYGPEEYCLRKALRGMYKIQSNYYGSSAPALSSQVTVQVEIFSNFGRADEKRRAMTLRLKESRDTYTVGEVEF
ncbi:MAG TPA: DUF2135 domain-containing protein, partial [Candidatus Ozemobacteraceae bacterium]|nr:DUF2135 domain-containing protein [Candidatus Ozemobacteraceae bacterium]